MSSAPPSPFSIWQNFYVIVGSAAGALTGLQFVVIAVIAQIGVPGEMQEIRAFGTPTVVHFCTALFIAALMVMPWQEPTGCLISLVTLGMVGTVYSVRVISHARKAKYSPDLEDWLWYTALPVVAHVSLVVAGLLLPWNTTRSLFGIAGDCLLFLVIGIHNSWDTVTYIAVNNGTAGDQQAKVAE